MSTIWSIITNRKDGISKVWKEWRSSLLDVSTGAADAGAVVRLGADGKIDPSMLPASGGDVVVTTMTAGETIGAFQAVAVHSDGLVYKASATNPADASQTIGIAITSAVNPGDTLRIQQVGFLSNLGWNWSTPGQTLYLGPGGTVVTTVPAHPSFELTLGTTLSNTEVGVQIGLPIILA
jgi:hypothetical protein